MAPGATFVPLERGYHYWNSRSTLRYKPSNNLMLYVSAANGTKSGGFNGRATFAADTAYGPETNWTYEAGVKGGLLDHRIVYELAVYHIDAKNLQILGNNTDPNNPGQVVKNYGAARNTGFELQTVTALTPNINLSVGLAYNDPRFDGGSVDAQYAGICAAIASCAPNLIRFNGAPAINIDGYHLPRQSRYQVTSGLDASLPLRSNWKLNGLIKYSFQSRQYNETANFSYYGATHNVGARLGLGNGHLSATAWVENLLDQTNAYSAFYNIRITDFMFETLPLYNDKRTIGLTVGYKY